MLNKADANKVLVIGVVLQGKYTCLCSKRCIPSLPVVQGTQQTLSNWPGQDFGLLPGTGKTVLSSDAIIS